MALLPWEAVAGIARLLLHAALQPMRVADPSFTYGHPYRDTQGCEWLADGCRF